jgi:hypothetical protein
MLQSIRLLILALVVGLGFATAALGDDKAPPAGPACARVVDDYFKDEVWAKVGVTKCLTCHKQGGDAEKSQFILVDPRKKEGTARDEAMKHNRAAFAKMATLKEKDQFRMLLKVVGGLDHGGSEVLKPDSTEHPSTRMTSRLTRRCRRSFKVSRCWATANCCAGSRSNLRVGSRPPPNSRLSRKAV